MGVFICIFNILLFTIRGASRIDRLIKQMTESICFNFYAYKEVIGIYNLQTKLYSDDKVIIKNHMYPLLSLWFDYIKQTHPICNMFNVHMCSTESIYHIYIIIYDFLCILYNIYIKHIQIIFNTHFAVITDTMTMTIYMKTK